MEDRKKHAYFQDQYRRSSNFGKMNVDSRPDAEKDGTIHINKGKSENVKNIGATVDDLLDNSDKS